MNGRFIPQLLCSTKNCGQYLYNVNRHEDVSLLGHDAEVLQSFVMLETTRPMTKRHVSGDLNLQWQHCDSLKSFTSRYTGNELGQAAENNSILNKVTEYYNVFSWFA